MTYDPTKYFFKGAVRPEPPAHPPFTYRQRSFADLACRLSQSHRGVPAVAPRPQPDSLCRRCGLRKADHGGRKNPFRACSRFQSPFTRANSKRKEKIKMIHGEGNVQTTIQAEGDVKPLRRVLLTRPITAPPDFGFHHDVEAAADQCFQAWKLLLEENSVGEISAQTGLSEQFIAALADRFW